MNTMETILFPDTSLAKTNLYPLLLFCTPLHFLQVIEGVADPAETSESIPFLDHGLWKAHQRGPAAPKRRQFLETIEDITREKEQLADNQGEQDPAPASAPLAALLKKKASQLADDDQQRERVQAQLTLALAEVFEREEEAIRDQFSLFGKDELVALREMQDSSNTDAQRLLDELAAINTQLDNVRLTNAGHRFKAWLRLLKEQVPPPVSLWLASSWEVAEPLFERYASSGKGVAVPQLKLALPAHFRESPKYVVQQIEKFQGATVRIHQGLVDDFEKLTSSPYEPGSAKSLLPYQTDWAGQWEAVLYELFPESNYGRSHITFFLLPHRRVPELLSLTESSVPGTKRSHGLLGVLETPKPASTSMV